MHRSANRNKNLGELGEKIVERLLIQKGLITITRNYRGQGFELDLIMYEKGNNTYFLVEVKLRQTSLARSNPTLNQVETLVSRHKLTCLRNGFNDFYSKFPCEKNASFSMKLALVTLFTKEKTVKINFFDLDG